MPLTFTEEIPVQTKMVEVQQGTESLAFAPGFSGQAPSLTWVVSDIDEKGARVPGGKRRQISIQDRARRVVHHPEIVEDGVVTQKASDDVQDEGTRTAAGIMGLIFGAKLTFSPDAEAELHALAKEWGLTDMSVRDMAYALAKMEPFASLWQKIG